MLGRQVAAKDRRGNTNASFSSQLPSAVLDVSGAAASLDSDTCFSMTTLSIPLLGVLKGTPKVSAY